MREAVPLLDESTEAILTRLLRSPTVTRDRRPIGEVATRRWAREKNDIGRGRGWGGGGRGEEGCSER